MLGLYLIKKLQYKAYWPGQVCRMSRQKQSLTLCNLRFDNYIAIYATVAFVVYRIWFLCLIRLF